MAGLLSDLTSLFFSSAEPAESGAARALPVLKVAVTCSRLIDNGEFAPSYREYQIVVSHGDNSWHVWRRFSQFTALQAALKGGAARAALPPRTMFTWHATSTDAAVERIPLLHHWLVNVTASDDATSPTLLAFLGLASTMSDARSRPPIHVRSLINGEGGESGDLVLFRTRANVPALQRLATRSHWDHIGVLLYLDGARRVCRACECDVAWGGEAGILECNAAGTYFYALRGYELDWHSLYDEIALRPLLGPQRGTPDTTAALHRWYVEVLGTPYLLTLGKLWRGVRAASAENVDAEPSAVVAPSGVVVVGGGGEGVEGAAGEEENAGSYGGSSGSGRRGSKPRGEEALISATTIAWQRPGTAAAPTPPPEVPSVPEAPRGFFCSELAAHCYQALGVLAPGRPASGYWPVDFGEGTQLPFTAGAQLGGETTVDFLTPAVDAIS